MKKRLLIAPLILMIGIALSMVASAFESRLNEEANLAASISSAADRAYDDFVFARVSPKTYNLTSFTENTHAEKVAQIQKRLVDRGFVVIEERSPSTHGTGRFLCVDYGDDGVLIFKKKDDQSSYIALSHGYKRKLTGCKFSVTQMVSLDLKEDK